MELRFSTVVAALVLVPLATALPTASSTPPPSGLGGRPAHGWGSWPPPYEDEDDDEDGFLGPRALPLEEQPVPQDADMDPQILAEYRAAAATTEGDASKVLDTRDVSNSTVVDAASSSQSNNSDSSVATGARESKSLSSSAVPASVAPVKPVAGQKAAEGEGKPRPTPAPATSTQSGDSPAQVEAASAPQGGSDAPQHGDLAPSAEASSAQPAEVEAESTAPAEAVSETSSALPDEETAWTAYDASAADDDADVVGQQEDGAAVELRSRTAEREAADEQEPSGADEPVSRGRVAPAVPSAAAMDAASITGIALGIVVFSSLVGAVSFVMYRRRYLNKPQTLNDKCSNPDSSGYIDDSTLRENSEEMYSLDNDSFLNSLEAMTIQNYWTDNVKHTKL